MGQLAVIREISKSNDQFEVDVMPIIQVNDPNNVKVKTIDYNKNTKVLPGPITQNSNLNGFEKLDQIYH